jgi:hypothetical protein
MVHHFAGGGRGGTSNLKKEAKNQSKRRWSLYVVESSVFYVYWNTLYNVPPYSLVLKMVAVVRR